MDVLKLLIEIDTTVRTWEPDGKGTLDRRHRLVTRGWRPQDCDRIADYTARVERWVVAGIDLLTP